MKGTNSFPSTRTAFLFQLILIVVILDKGLCIYCYSCGSNSDKSDCYKETSSTGASICPEDMPFCYYTINREPWIYSNGTLGPLLRIEHGCAKSMSKVNCLEGKYCTWKTCWTDFCNCHSPECANSATKQSISWILTAIGLVVYKFTIFEKNLKFI